MEKNLQTCKNDNQWSEYYTLAEKDIDSQWEWISSMLQSADFTTVVDLACGAGRNTLKLAECSQKVFAVDVNEYALVQARENLREFSNIVFIKNNGTSLEDIPDGSVTLLYSFDSLVHCHRDVIACYVKEAARILAPGGRAFLHHSNLANIVTTGHSDFRKNVHWRENMRKEDVAQSVNDSGLVLVEQKLISWGIPDLDCFTIFTKG